MNDAKALTAAEREDLIAYLDNEAEPAVSERLQQLLDRNSTARHEKELLEKSWKLLDVLERPPAPPGFKERTASIAFGKIEPPKKAARRRSWFALGWLSAGIAGFLGGLAIGWAIPDANRRFLLDLPLLERFDQFRACRDVGFVRRLRDSKVLDHFDAAPRGGSGGS